MEDGVKGDHEAAFGGLVVDWMIEDSFWRKDNDYRLCVVAFEEESGVEDGIGGEQFAVLLEQLALL